MSMQSPVGTLDIKNATLRVGKLEVSNIQGVDTALNVTRSNAILIYDDQVSTTTFTGFTSTPGVRDTSNGYLDLADGYVYWGQKLPNSWVMEFEMDIRSGTSAGPLYSNIFSTSNVGGDGYTFTFNDNNDKITLKYDGTTLTEATVSGLFTASENWQKVAINYERGRIAISIGASRKFFYQDIERSTPYVNGEYVNFSSASTDGRKIRNLKITNGTKWTYAGESNVAFQQGSVGIGVTDPAYTLDVGGDINLSGSFYQGGSPFVSSLWTDGANSLYYRSNVEVGTGNLFVDTTTSNVGIRTTTPAYELDVAGNVHADYFLGDGSLLTGLVTKLEDVVDNGNVSSNTIQLTNTDVGLKATGNVEAARFIGDGSHLTGLVTDLQSVVDNGNVSSNTIQLTNTDVGLKATGNVEAARFIGDGSHLTGLVTDLQSVVDNGNVSSNTIQLTNTDVGLKATGNVEAARFIGDGSHLTGLVTDLQSVSDNGNTTSNTIQFTNSTTGFVTSSNVGIANTNPQNDLDVGSNLSVLDTGSNVLSVTGNVSATSITIGDFQIVSAYGLDHVTNENNQTTDTIISTNATTGFNASSNIVAGGTVQANKIVSTSNLEVGTANLFVDTTTSNVGIGTNTPDYELDVVGNVNAAYFIGDGSAISAIQSSNVSDFGSNVSRITNLESSRALKSDLNNNSSRITNLSSNLSDNSSRITALESGDISISGDKTFTGDIIFESNVHMNSGNVFVANTVNLTVSDPIIELGSNNSGTNDLGIIMTRPNNNSNVAVVFDESVDILRMGYTLNGASDSVVDLDSNALAVSVQGALSAGSNLEVGTANLFVDTTTSNVGVGISSPAYKLDVDGDINLSTGSTLKINGTDAVFSNWTASGSDIYRSSGNVGIGTTSPAATLDIRGAVADPSTPTVHIGDNVADAGDYGMVNLVRDGTNGGSKSHLAFIRNTHTVVGMGFHNNTNTWGIFPSFNGVTNTPGMAITSDSKVGIGTATPRWGLEVTPPAGKGGVLSCSDSAIFSHNLYYSGGWKYGAASKGGAYMRMIDSEIQFWNAPNSGSGTWDTAGGTATTTQRMTIDESGNVGIGATSPSAKLHVVGTTQNQFGQIATFKNSANASRVAIVDEQTTPYIPPGIWGESGGGLALGTQYTGIKFFASENGAAKTERMFIKGNGNVGIGTTSPGRTLEVYTGNGNVPGLRLRRYQSGATYTDLRHADSPDGLAIHTSDGNATTLEVMRICGFNGGLVGIGTTSPSSKLQVEHSSGDLCRFYRPTSTAGQPTTIHLGRNSATNDCAQFRYVYGGTTNNSSSRIDLGFYGNGSILNITANDRVGIGRTDPDYTLDVNGTTRVGNILYIGKNTNDETAKSIFFGGTYGDNDYNNAVIERRVWSTGTEKQELLLFSGNDGETTAGPDRIRLKGAQILFDTLNSGTDRTTQNTKMIIKADGNVGIGTTTMIDSRNTGGLHLPNSKGISFAASTNSNSRHWRIRTDDYSDHGSLQIGVSDNNSTCPDAQDEAVMTMTRGRAIGIGNTSPSGKLHVSGEINASAFTVRDTGSFGNSYDGVFMRPDGQVYISVDDHLYIRDNQSTSSSVRRHHLDTNSGNFRCTGNVSGGASLDYAEYFEWFDGNPDNEDRIGCSVSLVENTTKIKKCEPGEIPLGVVSGSPSMVGGEAGILWAGYWKNDEWGRPTYKQLEDDNGELVFNEDGTPKMKRAINPEYDENLANEYLPRSERKEWACVGLLGQVFVKKGAVTSKNWIKMKEIDAIKDIWFINATFTNNENIENQLQAEKTKTATLETQVAALLARVTALENA